MSKRKSAREREDEYRLVKRMQVAHARLRHVRRLGMAMRLNYEDAVARCVTAPIFRYLVQDEFIEVFQDLPTGRVLYGFPKSRHALDEAVARAWDSAWEVGGGDRT